MADKPQLTKMGTMVVTAKIGKELLAGEKLGDTRQATVSKKARKLKKGSTMVRTIEEAKILLGRDSKLADVDSVRSLRTRREPKETLPEVKRKRKAPAPASSNKAKKMNSGPSGDNLPIASF